MAKLAEPLMKKGGILFTMTYYGSQTVVKNYNIMGVAKAALESAVRCASAELGPKRNSRISQLARTAFDTCGFWHSRV
jgi:enoyl-[acyl-carrier protein] reductase I